MTVSGDVSFDSNLSVQNNLNIIDGTVTNKQIIPVSNLPYYALGPTPSFTNNEIDIYSDFSGNLSVLNGRYDISASSILTDDGITYNPSTVFDGTNNTYWSSSGDKYDESTYTGSVNTNTTINGEVSTISGEYIEVILPFHIRLREISIGCKNNLDTGGTDNDNIKIDGLSIVAETNNIWYQVHSSNLSDLNIHDVSSIAIDTDIYANKFRYIITKITDQVFDNAIVSDLSFSGDVIGSTIHMNNGSIGIGAENPRSALEVVGDVTISKAHSGKNTSGASIEHGRISWCGKDNHKMGSYIRSYFEKDTLDTSGNLAFGTSDGSTDAVDRFILHSDGVSNFISDVSMDANLVVGLDLAVSGDVSMNSKLSIGNVARFNNNVLIGKNTIDDVNNYVLDVSGSIRTTNISITKDISTTGTVGSGKIKFDDGTASISSYPMIQPSSDKEGIEIMTGDSINFHISKDGDVSLNSDLIVNGDISLNSKFFVNGDVSLNANLFIGGITILHRDASMNAGLTVAEDVSLNSNLNVVGNSQFTTVTTSGDISANAHFRLGNNLQVNGDASFNQHVEISGNLVVNGFFDAQSFQNINTKNTTVENYTLIFSEDISLNGRIDVSGGANINNRFIVDPEAGNVKIIDQNITIGKEIYLDKLISEAVFSDTNMTMKDTIQEAAEEKEKIISFSNATYKIQASSVNTGSSDNNPRRALNNNDNSWKTMTRQYDINDAYTGSQNTKYKDIGDTPTVSNISGEWIQITFPYETVIDSFQLHTSEFQLPKRGVLLAYTGDGTDTDVSWTQLAEYNANNVSPNSMVNTDMSSNQITTRVIRLVIDKISTSNRSTENYHNNNLAIRFLNFSGTYKDTGILYGSGNSQSAGNTGIGFSTLTGNVTGKNNIAIGGYSLAQTTDSNNVGVGYNSLELTSSGGKNVGIGTDSLSDNTTGSGNIALGYFAGINNVDGSFNSFVGYNSGTNGDKIYSYSTALGQNARITDNHQLVLGTVDDTVVIPGDVSYISVNNVDVSYINVNRMDVSGATIKTLTVPSGQTPVQLKSGLVVSNQGTSINAGLTVGTASTTTIQNETTIDNTLDVTGNVSVNNINSSGIANINDLSAQDIIVSDFSSTASNNIKSGYDQILRLTQGSSSTYTNNSYIDFDNGDDIQIKANVGLELIAVDNISISIGNTTRLFISNTGQITLSPATGQNVFIDGSLRTGGTISTTGLTIAADSITASTSTGVDTGVFGTDNSGGPMITADQPINNVSILRFGIMDGAADPPGKTPASEYNPFQIETPAYLYTGVGTSIYEATLQGNKDDPDWGRATFGYNVIMNQDLSNNRTIYGKSLVMDSSSILHDLTVTNDTSLNNLDVSGTSTLNSLDVSSNVTFGANLDVSSNVTFGANLDVSGTTILKSSIDVNGSSLFQNGTFEINDNSFNLTNIPMSITGDFSGNTKVIYSQYHGSDRVFNGAYDISASSNSSTTNAYNVFGHAYAKWESAGTYESSEYKGTTDISHTTTYYPDDIGTATTISGEYMEFKYPFSMKVTDICFGVIADSTNTIGSAKLVGEVNNQWKPIFDISINAMTVNEVSTATVSNKSFLFTNKLRLILNQTRTAGWPSESGFPSMVTISQLSFSGDVVGSKFHVSDGNVGIGTNAPRSELDVDGDIILSKAHSGLNETGSSIEHGRISWLGRQRDARNNTSSYIRSYYDNNTYDTCGNLALGTSDGSNNATDHIILHSSGNASFSSDINVNSITVGRGSGDISTNTAIGYQALYDNSGGNYNVAIGFGSLETNFDGSHNVAMGSGALQNNITGSQNTANGSEALYDNSGGSYNVANGYQALYKNTTGNSNVANGSEALYTNTSGHSNVANGTNALFSNIDGSYNVANGRSALYSNTIGSGNVANGYQALYTNEDGNYNVATGSSALYKNTADYNTATGYRALTFNTTGTQNTATGSFALYSSITGSGNVANGYQALYTNEDGSMNVATGYQALYSNIDGSGNVANGYQALKNNIGGSNNVANGYQALYTNEDGNYNVANGYQALYTNEDGNYNVANGYQALHDNSGGNYNVANGTEALYANTTGNDNTANGYKALITNISGHSNVATGRSALQNNTIGDYNTANGPYALASNIGGSNNTANGRSALYFNTAGVKNVAIGYEAGLNSMGSYNTFLGAGTNGNYTTSTAIGYGAQITASNQIMLGTSNEQVKVPGSIRMSGATYADGGLYVSGTVSGITQTHVGLGSVNNTSDAYKPVSYAQATALALKATLASSPVFTGTVSAYAFNAASDYRIKENVVPISDTSYNIDNLRPVTYTNTKTEKQDFGVIAHEIQEQIPFLVTGEKDGEDHQAVNYNGLIGLLLNEVQQLKKRVQELEQSKP